MQATAAKGYPLSIQQQRIWEQQANQKPLSVVALLQGEGMVQIEILERALESLIETHTILRTVFRKPKGLDVPVQVVLPQVTGRVEQIDLQILDRGDQEKHITAIMNQECQEPFALHHGPLLCLRLLRQDSERFALLVSLSSMCGDSTTLKLLLSELSSCYSQLLQGKLEERAEEPLHYADVSAWQKKLLLSKDAEKPREFWRNMDVSELSSPYIPFQGQQEILPDQYSSSFPPFFLLQGSIASSDHPLWEKIVDRMRY